MRARLRGAAGLVALLLLLLPSAPAVQASADTTAVDLIPASDVVPRWSLSGEPLQFPQDSLWQHIDGADRQYISFGCTSLAVATYRKDRSESEITLEIYEMKDDLGSFGIYTLEKPKLDSYLAIGAEGYQDGGALNFFGGRFYVKLQAYPAKDAEIDAMRQFADAIAEKHLSGSKFPDDLALFPTAYLVAGSFELVPEGVLGMSGLSRALAAHYAQYDDEMTLYLVREGDPESAGKAFASVQTTLEKHSKAPLRRLTIAREEGFRAELEYHGAVIVLRSRGNIILAASAEDAGWALSTAAGLIKNLAASEE